VLGKDIVQAGDPPSVEAENYWFRLLDADSRKPVWMFRIPAGFSYQLDRPFFHVFQGRSRRFGFLFEDDDEATAFARKVTSQTQPPRKHRTLSLSRKRSNLNQGSRRTVSPTMISAPTLHSFVHVAHVGISDDGAIEASKDIDPSWKVVLGGLRTSKMVPDGQVDFVEGFWKDVDTIDRSGNSSETTIVGNDIQIKSAMRPGMNPRFTT